MHDNSSDDNEAASPDPPEPETQNGAVGSLSAVDCLHLAEECLVLASLTKDPEKISELVKTADDYLRRAAEWVADQINR
jgi:hypothetical protein